MSANVLYFPAIDDVKTQEVQIVADCDEGYTRIANKLLEAICCVEITARQMRVFLAIVRKTYGYQKKADWIAADQIAAAMNYSGNPTHIHADIRGLKERKLIIEDGRRVGPNPTISEWVFSKTDKKTTDRKRSLNKPKTVTKQTEIGHFTDRKRSPQKKDINTKENIKETIVGKPDESARQIIDYLNLTAGKKFKQTKTNHGFINARIKDGFSIDDLKSVIDKKTAEWSTDARMSQYLRPATLFNAEKCDGYLNAPAQQPRPASTNGRIAYNPTDTSWADGFDPFDPMEL